jgi:hypothetical protein
MLRTSFHALLSLAAVSACSSTAHPGEDAGHRDAPLPADARSDATLLRDSSASDVIPDVDKAATCAVTFGDALTNAFGRIDGIVLAVVPPADDACADVNGTHLVVQVTLEGVAYRMVLDVLSDSGNPDVFFYEEDAALAAGAWAEGWHAGVSLDYVGTLGLHSTQFTEMTESALVDKVTSEIQFGDPISVFATSAGESNSAHLIHRNLTNQDGAIVLRPQSATPHYLLFRFSDQTF